MIKNNNYLDSLPKSLIDDVRSVMESKKCKKGCECNKCSCDKEEKDEKEMKEGYNKDAVDKAIASSNRSGKKIGGREAKMIHALLKGRTPKKDEVKEEAEQIDEISKKLATDYFHAKQDKARKDFMRGRPTNKKGIFLAKDKIEGRAKVPATNEEVQLGEEVDFAKVRKQFDRNEDRNEHSKNAVLIAKHAGTPEHHKEAMSIYKQHNKLGYLSGDLMKRREALYKQLEKTDNYKKIFPEHKIKEDVDLEEANKENKLKKNIYVAKKGKEEITKGINFAKYDRNRIADNKGHDYGIEYGDGDDSSERHAMRKTNLRTFKVAGRAKLAKEEVDLEEAKKESPIAGTRLVSKHEGKDGHHAEVRYNRDWNEYSVHHYHNGKHMGEGPVSYHGDGKEGREDATDTAEHAVKNFHVKGGKLLQIKESLTILEKKKKMEHDDEYEDEWGEKETKKKKTIQRGGKREVCEGVEHDSDTHKIEVDRMGHYTITHKPTNKSVYLQGDDARHFDSELEKTGGNTHKVDRLASDYHHVMEAKKMEGEDPCWKNYKMVGTKKGKGGKEVPNCVPEETEVNEKLIGKQHKLDKNKNGKLDSQDFKMLRKEEASLEEKLNPSMGAAKYIQDFVKSKDPRFEGKTKKERIKMALGAFYGAKNESVETEETDTIDEAYGDKRDYKKHHIYVNGRYVATTTWARNAKEAEKKFLKAHPEHKNKRISVEKEG